MQRREGESWIDYQIRMVKAAFWRGRAARIAKGKASTTDYLWFGIGFGRGRYAGARYITLLFWMMILYLIKGIRTLANIIQRKRQY